MAKQIAKPLSKASALPAVIAPPIVQAGYAVVAQGDLYVASLATFTDQLKLVKPGHSMPQAALLAANKAHKIADESKSAYDYFRDYASMFRDGGGKFDPGKMAIVFKDDAATRKPKWKEQAVAEAAEVYRLRAYMASQGYGLPADDWQPAEKFDREGYEKAVLDDTPKPEGKTQVQLILSD